MVRPIASVCSIRVILYIPKEGAYPKVDTYHGMESILLNLQWANWISIVPTSFIVELQLSL